MSKHTHGPWHYSKNQRTFGIYMAEGVPVAKVHGVGEIIEPRKEADARLIAAAPDLLAALSEIINYAGGADSAIDDQYVMDRAVAALNKATGDES